MHVQHWVVTTDYGVKVCREAGGSLTRIDSDRRTRDVACIEKVRWSKVEGAKVESVMAVPLTVPLEAIADVAAAVDEVLARGVVPQAAGK